MKRVHVTASGQVQGVFFRASVRDEARRLGLTGWARNTHRGEVQAEFQGEDTAVDRAVAFCRDGPGHAIVTDLRAEPAEPVDGEAGFDVE
ncbi:MAG: acylphosphatase [Egibacteraceae bacterium]